MNWISPSPLCVDLTPTPCSKITSGCQMSACRELCIPYSANFFSAQASRCTHSRLPMDYGRASAHFNTSEVIKASMLATFERGPTANILHTSPRYFQQKHTEACCAHATHKIAYYLMDLEDKHTVSIPSYLNHNSCLSIPPYLQSIFAFLCSLKVAGRHFSILTLF